MSKIAASTFKEQCLSLIDNVDEEGIVITKHGKAVAKLVAYREGSKDLIGSLKGSLEIRGNVMSTGVRWHAKS